MHLTSELELKGKWSEKSTKLNGVIGLLGKWNHHKSLLKSASKGVWICFSIDLFELAFVSQFVFDISYKNIAGCKSMRAEKKHNMKRNKY